MPTTREIDWLAGLFEGEGSSFRKKNGSGRVSGFALQLIMTDGDVVCRAARIMDAHAKYYKRREENWKPVWRFEITGVHAVGWAMILYDLLGERRQARLRELLLEWSISDAKPRKRRACYASQVSRVSSD